MQNLILSYGLSFETKIKVGTVPGNLTQEDVHFIHQDGGNELDGGKCLKLALTIGAGAPQAKTLDLRDYNINYVRTILVKCTDSTAGTPTAPAPLKVKVEFDGTSLVTGKTAFVDIGEPASLPVPVLPDPLPLILTNLNATAISVIVIVAGY